MKLVYDALTGKVTQEPDDEVNDTVNDKTGDEAISERRTKLWKKLKNT